MFLQEYFGLDGKTVLVTGGNRGIGQEVAVDLAKAGARIAVFSRSGAEETVKKIRDSGGEAQSFLVDVQSEESIKNGVARVIQVFGKIDVLFNNAGITIHKTVLDADYQDWERIL